MQTKPTSKGVLVGLGIIAIVLAIVIFYLVKSMASTERADADLSVDPSESLATPAASAASGSDEIPVIEADLMTIKQELMRIEAESH